MSYEMKNIEKNMEKANQRAVHPRHFDSQAAFAESVPFSNQQFPFGSAAGSDPLAAGQFSAFNRPKPELSNYPGTRFSPGGLLSRPPTSGGFGGSIFPSSMQHTGLPASRLPSTQQQQPQVFPSLGGYGSKY